MIINALRFRQQGRAEPLVWRFTTGLNNLGNFRCLYGNEPTLIEVGRAVRFALSGEGGEGIADVALHFSDRGGNTWIIQRSSAQGNTTGKIKFMRNGIQFSEKDAEVALFSDLWDLDQFDKIKSAGAKKANLVSELLEIDLDESDNLIVGPFVPDSGEATDQVRKALSAQLALNLEALKTSPEMSQLDSPRLLELATQLKPLFLRYRELSSQRADLLLQAAELSKINHLEVKANLEKELSLTESISVIINEITSPLNQPLVVEEKIRALDRELERLRKENKLAIIPENGQYQVWKSSLENLCNLEVLKTLVQTTEQSKKLAQEKISAFLENFLQKTRQILTLDLQICEELDSCLSTLALKMDSSSSTTPGSGRSKAKEKGFSSLRLTWFDRFLAEKDPSDKERMESNVLSDQKQYETARLAVDCITKHINKLSSHLEKFEKEHDTVMGTLEKRYENVSKNYEKMQKIWKDMAKKNNLPQTLSMEEMLRLIFIFARVAEIRTQKEELQEILRVRKVKLAKLEQLVKKWRNLTESHKSGELKNSAIIISEAHAILRLKQEKEKRLCLLAESRENILRVSHLLGLVDTSLNNITSQWNKVFDSFALGETGNIENSENWDRFFEKTDRLHSLNGLLDDLLLDQRKGPFKFGEKSGQVPLKIYIWRKNDLSIDHRQRFISLIESVADSSQHLLLLADRSLVDMLAKKGVGKAVQIPRTMPKPISGTINTSVIEKPTKNVNILSPKARTALETLTRYKKDQTKKRDSSIITS